MRLLGIILVVVGVICLAVPSVTFWTQERAVDAGFIQIDVQRPHTIILNPVVGVISLIAGSALLLTGGRKENL